MADHKDEEYHFSETETSVPYTTDSKPLPNRNVSSAKRNRAIILFVAICMAIWAIYKFTGIFSSETKPIPKKTPTTPPPAASIKPNPQPVIQKPVQSATPIVSLQEFTEQKDRLNKLEAQVVNLQTTLSDTNTKLGDLSNQISTLSSQINKPPPPPVEVKKPRPKKHFPVKKAFYRNISYSYELQAAIPGRAWVMRSDGVNLTVSLGDKIPGYGKVVGIDPNDGVVEMESGATIKYRSH